MLKCEVLKTPAARVSAPALGPRRSAAYPAVALVALLGFTIQAAHPPTAAAAAAGSSHHYAAVADDAAHVLRELPRFPTVRLPKTPSPSPVTLQTPPPVIAPPIQTFPIGNPNTSGQPCHAIVAFVPNISQWTVPPGCYGAIYTPNPANYVARPSLGYCDWWVMVLHPDQPNILYSAAYRRGSVPVPGAAIFIAGGVQGASPDGHFAQVMAIAPDHYWILITEMNFSWRGGGWGRVDYRYIHVGPGVSFIYP